MLKRNYRSHNFPDLWRQATQSESSLSATGCPNAIIPNPIGILVHNSKVATLNKVLGHEDTNDCFLELNDLKQMDCSFKYAYGLIH